ncbi:MAG: hypothetical protein ACOYLQ_07020 [Hyphomicrobiaceae bacterium]
MSTGLRLAWLASVVLTVSGVQARADDQWLAERFSAKNSAAADAAGAARDGAKPKPEDLKPNLRPHFGRWQWKITKTASSEADEQGYEAFVTAIGESDCATVHDCITSPVANPRFSGGNPPYYTFFADCADLPYFLRAYYASRNGLPFSFSYRYNAHPRSARGTSSVTGNVITKRQDIVGPGPDMRIAWSQIGQFVSSEHFRTPGDYKGKLVPDHYPVRLTRESIRPGTVIFDPDGHLAVVYKVTADGRIHYIDSHPDNSLTRGVYNREFARTEPEMGAGFKRYRPFELRGAKRLPDGSLVGGRIVHKTDAELPDWSLEQFYGTEPVRPAKWSGGSFALEGRQLDYYDYLRFKLASPGFKYSPVEEIREAIRGLCQDIKYRVDMVEIAIKAGMHRRPQPHKLPDNIYATKGDWETYSTPSRDARLKTSFEELRDEIARFIDLFRKGSDIIRYSGSDLRRDLAAVYREETASCTITYQKSDGRAKTLTFADVKERLFDLSFDPHHCPELRWGARDSDELASCPDDAVKRAWYVAQDRLRNQVTRTYGEPMGWTLAQMQNGNLDIGIKDVPVVEAHSILMASD